MKSLSLSTPHVIFVIGIPGAGKTYFASKFADTFNAPFVEADKLRAAHASEPSFTAEEQHVVEYLVWLQMQELFKTKQTFIVEGGTEAKVDRQNLAKLVRSHGYEPLFVWVQTDPVTARTRATKSSRMNRAKEIILPSDRYDHLVKRFTAPGESEKALVISGKHTYASQVKAVLKRLARPNRPSDIPLHVPARKTIKGNSIKIS